MDLGLFDCGFVVCLSCELLYCVGVRRFRWVIGVFSGFVFRGLGFRLLWVWVRWKFWVWGGDFW